MVGWGLLMHKEAHGNSRNSLAARSGKPEEHRQVVEELELSFGPGSNYTLANGGSGGSATPSPRDFELSSSPNSALTGSSGAVARLNRSGSLQTSPPFSPAPGPGGPVQVGRRISIGGGSGESQPGARGGSATTPRGLAKASQA